MADHLMHPCRSQQGLPVWLRLLLLLAANAVHDGGFYRVKFHVASDLFSLVDEAIDTSLLLGAFIYVLDCVGYRL